MKKDCKKVNEKLLEAFPELKHSFEEETSWQDGIYTGSTVVYEDVFKWFIQDQINSNNEKNLVRIFEFIEKMITTDDEYQKYVIEVAIIEWLAYSDVYSKVEKYLLPNTKITLEKMKNSI